MLTIQEHLIVCLNEECVEIAKRCDKILRFGIDDRDPTYESAPTERDRVHQELTDLMAVIEMLDDFGIISKVFDPQKIAEKKAKIEKFMHYAREHGALR